MTSTTLREAILPLLERCFRRGGILGYHAVVENAVPSPEMHVSLDTLREQLEYVRDRYDVISLRELVQRRHDDKSTDNCVSITFDDAYVGVERLAKPLLERLDLPATIFATVSATETGAAFWWDNLENARLTSPDVLWPRLLELIGLPRRQASREALSAAREHLLAHYAGRLPATLREFAAAPSELLRSMNVEALLRLSHDERFEFGCHTLTHPVLPSLSSREQEIEMAGAQRRLEEVLPRVVPIVAYPFGLYNSDTLSAAKRAGFHAGVTMQARALAKRDHPLALPRVGISEQWSPSAIALHLNAGLRVLYMVRGGIHPRLPARVR